ncbi:MAG: carbamoyltransferase HypF [Lachnospiraceae bacterium]|nr:carbamoyltransferase HypF [Lachnospiraceae bacterium]
MYDTMKACRLRVYGLVQGVGFRPYVAQLAAKLHIGGEVCNSGGIVHINAYGSNEAMEEFLHRLSLLSEGNVILPGSFVSRIEEDAEKEGAVLHPDHADKERRFRIMESSDNSDVARILPVDYATCERCEKELLDPKNRRYRYPFISCASCGPRYTIMEALPYDRERTSMAQFPMCDACKKEYEDITDVRCFAQTIGCPDCGPKLKASYRVANGDESVTGDEALQLAVAYLKQGKILAVKDIGGYHFVFDPKNAEAAKRLRRFKHRDQKPFAVMFADTEELRKFCAVSETEKSLLESNARPIVLVDINNIIVNEIMSTKDICGFSSRVGAMLPSNPLQILLVREFGPLVMTSGNRGGEPIEVDDTVMLTYMQEGHIDLVLSHDRQILQSLDDSIYQVVKKEDGTELVQILRRARGSVPDGIRIPGSFSEDVLLTGGDLKAVFGIGHKNLVYLSGHFGDLEEVACIKRRREAYEGMCRLFDVAPKKAVCDLHPSYVSAKEAEGFEERPQVQHHLAHIGAVIAEHDLRGDVLGLSFDGTGYGTDGCIWGGEFLLWHDGTMKRVAQVSYVPLVGGDAAAKNPKMTALCYLYEAVRCGYLSGSEHPYFADPQYEILASAIDRKVNTVMTSSMGRLFDCVSAILGICEMNSFEGEAAMKLEEIGRIVGDNNKFSLDFDGKVGDGTEKYIKNGENPNTYEIDVVRIVADLVKAKKKGASKEMLARAFHEIISQASAGICDKIEVEQIALGGGCMQNRLLLQFLHRDLERPGRKVYINHLVPAGDGGLALGQAYLSLYLTI